MTWEQTGWQVWKQKCREREGLGLVGPLSPCHMPVLVVLGMQIHLDLPSSPEVCAGKFVVVPGGLGQASSMQGSPGSLRLRCQEAHSNNPPCHR